MTKINTEFKEGEKVPTSGIYKVVHDNKHREEHEVTVISGKRFPPCRGCGDKVRFVLVKKARHIERDDDLKS